MKYKCLLTFLTLFLVLHFSACINPFAPTKLEYDINQTNLGDQKTIDGFFQNFLYAYNFKDTVVYGKLLNDDFVFSYRNYDQGIELSWSRPEDMLTTYRLFNAAQNLDFIWNEIITQEGDDLNRTITRSFNLTITFSPTDIVRIYGRVYFVLKRQTLNDIWKLAFWRDDSNY